MHQLISGLRACTLASLSLTLVLAGCGGATSSATDSAEAATAVTTRNEDVAEAPAPELAVDRSSEAAAPAASVASEPTTSATIGASPAATSTNSVAAPAATVVIAVTAPSTSAAAATATPATTPAATTASIPATPTVATATTSITATTSATATATGTAPDTGTAAAAAVATVPAGAEATAGSAAQPKSVTAAVLPPKMPAMSATSSTLDLYVATNGNDAWTGQFDQPNATQTDGPLRTLAVAKIKVRAAEVAMAARGTRLPVRVRIAPGTYYLTAPLTFVPGDGGTVAAPVSYEAVTPGTVTISGGLPLAMTASLGAGGYVTYENPAAGQDAWAGGGQLFVNGKRAILARQPNAGSYWFVEKAVPLATEPAGRQGREAFQAGADALNWVGALSAADQARGIVNMMQAWTNGSHRLATGAPAGALRLSPAARWTFRNSGTGQRYFIENVAAALDAPGEFFWDATGVRYIPRAGETPGSLTAVMPVLDKLIVVAGNVGAGAWVEGLQFRGLNFAHTRSLVPAAGYLDWQAASDIGAAIEVDGARSVMVDNCRFDGTGGYGVWFRRAVRDSVVSNSSFDDLGAGAVRLGQITQQTTDLMLTGSNQVLGNRITQTGVIYPGAVGVMVGQSFDNSVSNNLIYNTSHTGILVGWDWSFGPATSGRNLIADNLLINIGLGVLSDFGAIYTTGVSPGTRITGNVIREVRGYPDYGAGAWGIYLDSGSSQITVANNIVLGADNGSFQATTTRSVVLQSNLLGLGDKTEFNLGTTDPLTALNASGNTFVPKLPKPLSGFATAPDVNFSANSVATQYVVGAIDLALCGSGCALATDTLAMTTDPRGVQLVSTDTAKAAAVAQTAAKSGPQSIINASSVVTVATQKPPVIVAPPIGFTIDIATAALGTQPLGMWYSTKTADLTVAANAAAPGGRCLQYTDSPANVNGYDPHSYAAMNHASGTTTGEFSLLIDAQTNFAHQWRDNAAPVKTGPELTVNATGVYVGGRLVAPVSVGQWMNFKVVAPLGGKGTTWTLAVTDGAGKVTTVADLPYRSAGFNRLNWWGFISNAKVASKFCLASVKATNQP